MPAGGAAHSVVAVTLTTAPRALRDGRPPVRWHDLDEGAYVTDGVDLFMIARVYRDGADEVVQLEECRSLTRVIIVVEDLVGSNFGLVRGPVATDWSAA